MRAQVVSHPARKRPYDQSKATQPNHYQPYPDGVVPLFPNLSRYREKVMPTRSPELVILTALLARQPKLAREIENELFAARAGEHGPEAEQAFNFMNLLVMGPR